MKSIKLPTLNKIIGIDKFNLTESQRNSCVLVANFYGFDAAIEQAKVFEKQNFNIKVNNGTDV